ncbi:hypothetical protein KAR91_50925 [Candidatus Pacearchaeota archaeon]|nr:hypothetical protein [Candidatus Pacearchaeota archaeon]
MENLTHLKFHKLLLDKEVISLDFKHGENKITIEPYNVGKSTRFFHIYINDTCCRSWSNLKYAPAIVKAFWNNDIFQRISVKPVYLPMFSDATALVQQFMNVKDLVFIGTNQEVDVCKRQ